MDHIENRAGIVINPATEDTQELIALLLAQLKFQGNGLETTVNRSSQGLLTQVNVDNLTTLLIDANPNRSNLVISTDDQKIYLSMDINCTVSRNCFRLPKNAIWEFYNYTGPVWACTFSGSTQISVTEFI